MFVCVCVRVSVCAQCVCVCTVCLVCLLSVCLHGMCVCVCASNMWYGYEQKLCLPRYGICD